MINDDFEYERKIRFLEPSSSGFSEKVTNFSFYQ